MSNQLNTTENSYSRKIKTLCIANDNDRPEREMLIALSKSGIDLHIIISPDSMHLEHYKRAEIPLTTLSIRSKIDLNAIKTIRDYSADKNFDIIHTFSKNALSNALFATKGTKVKHLTYRGIIGNLTRFGFGSRISFLSPRINSIACVCRSVEAYLNKFSSLKNKTLTIYKGHDLEWYKSVVPVSRDNLGIKQGNVVISCVANNRKRKGIKTLLEAVKSITDLPISLVLIGKGLDSESLQNTATNTGNVEIIPLGFRRDVLNCVAASDIFVLPSLRREGFPKAMIEAMCLAKPPIVTSVGGMAEVVTPKCGIVVPPSDSSRLAEAIRSLVVNSTLRAELGTKAKQRISKDFSIQTTIDSYKSLYRQLAE